MTEAVATKKDLFSSRFAFVLSTAGSAIGLANIWKFPYIVGKFGGGGFILVYLILLLFVGFPAFLSEILIGKTTKKNVSSAFFEIGKTKFWQKMGSFTVWTGFLVSSFYSVVAGWILGYFFEAISNNLHGLNTISKAQAHYSTLMGDPLWSILFHSLFAAICGLFLLGGIRGGIEKCNKIFMPLFFLILLLMMGWAVTLPSAKEVFTFMTSFDLKSLPASCFIIALGHAFFTLSVGQGSMATYGSYLKPGDKVLSSTLFVLLADTLVSLFAAFCILSIVFSANVEMEFGPGLIFSTLPMIFSQIPYSSLISSLFFFLIFIAALTSQLSALEPLISHLIKTRSISRKTSTFIVTAASFAIGIPSALSTNFFKNWTIFGNNFLECMSFTTTSILIPFGAFAAVFLIGWGAKNRTHISDFAKDEGQSMSSWFFKYVTVAIKYSAPVLIIYVLFNAIGIV